MMNLDYMGNGYLIESAVCVIGGVIEATLGINPTHNSGEEYKNDTFHMAAYDWSEQRDWNFRWRDFEVHWNKYIGRCMEVNRDLSVQEVKEMLVECIGSVK